MDHESLFFTLPSGRSLGYAFYGSSSPEATNIFYFHGLPSSRLEAAVLATPALSLNIRLIGVDRPGMGLSSYQEDRRVLDWPRDILDLADHLKIQQFSILAYSAGAIYAFACAKVIPVERLKVVQVMGGAYVPHIHAPFFLKGFQQLVSGGASKLAGSAMNSQWGTMARDPDPAKFYATSEKEMANRPEVDKQSLKGVERIALFDPMREAFRVDGKGVGLDIRLGSPDVGKWGFQLEEVVTGPGKVQLKLWHGGLDTAVTPALAGETASKLRCELQIFDDMGHVGIPILKGEIVLKDTLVKMHVGETKIPA
ncbi:Alpha/Beta hydrolase protein [Halenospora varia]|nr:Alpha/Beta hydrolase protein [Halenospora varia]